MLKKEFVESSRTVFEMMGFRQYKKKFIYEHEDMYLVFMLAKSNFSESYYHEFNFTIKKLHPEINPSEISDKEFDLLVYPRLILSTKMIPLELKEIEVGEYEKLLHKSLVNLLENVNKKGLKLIKEYEKNGCQGVPIILSEKAQELLINY